MRFSRLAASLAVSATVAGCAGPGQFVWYSQLPPEPAQATNEYIVGTGDTISIRVVGHDDLTTKQRVRSDGRLSLPLIGDVEASGKRPSALKAELEGRLKDYIVSPNIVVNVDDATPTTILLFGEVSHVGAIALDQDVTLAHALALGGGLSDFASKDKIFVVRNNPRPIRIRFTFEDVYRNVDGAGDFRLRRGDMIEVE